MPIIDRSYYGYAQQGRQDRQAYETNLLNQQQAQQQIAQQNRLGAVMDNPSATPEQFARVGRSDIGNSLLNIQGNQAEQAKAFAEQMANAVKYAAQAPAGQTKPFIEKNFPFLVQAYGPDWATATDEQVHQELQGIGARYGVQAGIAPPQQISTEQLAPDGATIVSDGKTFKVVQPRRVVGSTAQPRMPAPPRGFRYKTDGSVEPIPGGPNDPNSPNRPTQQTKPPTEGDKRARVMYFSMKNAEKQLEAVTASDTSDLGQSILGKIPSGRALQTDDYKRYESAGLRWAANLLYLKSGATATPDEIRSTWLQFFPQPGDGQSVKDQKNEARQQEMGAINDTYTFERVANPQSAPPQMQQTQQPVQIKSDAEYAALPSGTQYVAPDGSVRRKK